ncbi:hypothetical protein JY651_47830 [Pyxidicoccus parkwayensis]|uniref:Uncharacterized protein n=1 Tax=Pyxidicoccus parkwayensis TaxID=2813578 RepID=A0ABX7NV98_9BACT|nr:hypothetical protein [Pyxidicoccus parkwaysis]QSQ22730.1 hypothetical protein JY651_47830 [Pyxidicoccus parkwaysis]
MNRQESALFFGSLLLWIPLLLGLVVGTWLRKRVHPRVIAPSRLLGRTASSGVTRLWNIASILGWVGVMLACGGMMAPRTLAWLQTLGTLPFEPTPRLLQGVALFAAFMVGYTVGAMPRGAATQQLPQELANVPGATVSTPGPGNGQPVNTYSNTRLFAVIGGTMAVGLGLGALSTGLKKGGFLTTSDVGGLPELARIQEQLRPLEACSLTYQRRDRRGHRNYPYSVFIESCTLGEYISVIVDVPGTWAGKGVGFEMTRSSMSEPWEILVEKADVPFPELKEALEHFAPLIAAQYPEKLRERREEANKMERHLKERERLEQERKERAKTSYPD